MLDWTHCRVNRILAEADRKTCCWDPLTGQKILPQVVHLHHFPMRTPGFLLRKKIFITLLLNKVLNEHLNKVKGWWRWWWWRWWWWRWWWWWWWWWFTIDRSHREAISTGHCIYHLSCQTPTHPTDPFVSPEITHSKLSVLIGSERKQMSIYYMAEEKEKKYYILTNWFIWEIN